MSSSGKEEPSVRFLSQHDYIIGAILENLRENWKKFFKFFCRLKELGVDYL